MEELTPTVVTKDKVKEWFEHNKDIPYFVLQQFNGSCKKCGKMMFTEDNLLHWCV